MLKKTNKILSTHKAFLGEGYPINKEEIKTGSVIKFSYDGKDRTVFVLHPKYEDKLHGLSLNAVDRKTFLNEVVAQLGDFVSPRDFYNKFISRKSDMVVHSYRTFFIKDISRIQKLPYSL